MKHTSDGSIDESIVKERSTIYAKNPNNYQKTINDTSFNLCLKNPSLMLESKGVLLEMARKAVHESGYCYKKGQTRSKVLNHSQAEGDDLPQSKRQKINAYERQRRIEECREEISDFKRRIQIKERRLQQATSSHNFKMCDDLATEISELKSQQRVVNIELAGLQQKAKKAVEYQNRKKNTRQQPEPSDNTSYSGDSSAQSGDNSGEPNL